MVYGTRLRGGEPQRAHLFWHYAGNRFLSLLTNVLYNTTISDMEVGYKAFTGDLIRAMPLVANDFGFEPEVTAKLLKRPGIRLYEVPDQLLRAHLRRGQEDHLARRRARRRAAGALSLPAMTARPGRFPLFDSLRAIAALSVVVTHGAFYSGALGDSSAVRPYVARLDCGVTIFFLISGFLLYRPFAAAHIRGEPGPATWPYAWRRLLRIVPAYWVALTIVTIWFHHKEVFTLSGIPTYYGLAQAYRGSGAVLGGISQAWTLSVEVAFYVFLPFWAAALRRAVPSRPESRARVEVLAIAGLAVASLLFSVVVVETGNPRQVDFAKVELLSLPAYLDQFALGMLLAVGSVALEGRARQPGIVRAVDRFPALAWAGAVAAFVLVSRGIGLTGRFGEAFTPAQYIGRHLLYAAVALCLIVPAVFGDQHRGVVRRWVLGNPVLLYLGMVSYGIYLWHQAVFGQLLKWNYAKVDFIHPYVSWLLAGVAGTALIASASWYLIERPILSLKRLVPDPRRRSSAPVPATSRAAAER